MIVCDINKRTVRHCETLPNYFWPQYGNDKEHRRCEIFVAPGFNPG